MNSTKKMQKFRSLAFIFLRVIFTFEKVISIRDTSMKYSVYVCISVLLVVNKASRNGMAINQNTAYLTSLCICDGVFIFVNSLKLH